MATQAAAKKTAPTTLSVEMTHERDTKGTHVFKALDPNAKITSIYVKKGHFAADSVPAIITVAVK